MNGGKSGVHSVKEKTKTLDAVFVFAMHLKCVWKKGKEVDLVSLPSHNRSGFDMMEGHSAVQQAGVLQQRDKVLRHLL